MSVGQGDRAVWNAASDIAEAVSSSRSGTLGQDVMNALDRMVGCDLGSILTVVPGEEWSIAGEIADNRQLAQNYWRYSHEMRPEEVQRIAGRVATVDEAFAPHRRESLGVFREFLIPRGLRSVVVRNWIIDGRVYALGMARQGLSAFSDHERQRLAQLFPHLKAALRAGTNLTNRFNDYPAAGDGGPWGLTPAQERTMALTLRGLTNKEVASLLGVSPNTVRNLLVEVFRKVGVSRRSELAFIVRGGTKSDRAGADTLAWQRDFVTTIDVHSLRAGRASTAPGPRK